MRDWIRRILDSYQAWRRGEVRIAPPGMRGRVYSPARLTEPLSGVHARARLKGTMSLRIFRTQENCWYRVNPKTGEMKKE